jgi:DNA-binding CsgD family transcriptional regulator
MGRWPFVGRTRESTRALELLEAGVGVLLLGEPGVGKSALARELARRHGSSGAPVSHVVGHAVSSSAPFEVFAGALAESSGLAPGDHAMADVVTLALSSTGDRPGCRALIVVDDVQLVDDQSARVLLQVATAGTATVVATAPAGVQLPAAADRLWREGFCERLELAPLSVPEVGDLLDELLDGPVDSAAVHLLAERCGGNPLFLRELVTAALDQGLLVRRGVEGGLAWTLLSEPPVSSGIREIVTARLVGLPEPQLTALELVAAGEPLAAAVVADLVGDSVLDQLAEDGLVAVREGLAGPEVGTVHPIYGDVVRANLPLLRLHRLRLALAHRLESDPAPRPHDLVRAATWRLDSGQAGDPDQLLAAARAARGLSLATAERLARKAYEASGSLPAALLLAEVLTHAGRATEAAELTARLPPESLTRPDREAVVYCAAVGQGLLGGDPGSGADLVTAVLAGDAAASEQLRALQAVLLAFDARFEAALEVACPIVPDAKADPVARTLAALGQVGALYWLGRYRESAALADHVGPVAASARDGAPFGASSIELIAISALVEQGDLDAAEARAHRMRRIAERDNDGFAGPRAQYCLGRVASMRGQADTARRHFARALAGLVPFDEFIRRHLGALLAGATATCGDLDGARAALQATAELVRLRTYEPEDELAAAAVLAGALRMPEAIERASWAAGVAAAQSEWNVALAGNHDAARYGGARRVLVAMREAAAHVDGTLAWCYLDHAAALAARDGARLDEVARRFESHGALRFAAETKAESVIAHAAAGNSRLARAAGASAVALWARCECPPSPWLAGAAAAVPLTGRERQVAALAVSGLSDAAIADRLGISIRTVQTHLGHAYAKLGSLGRTDLAARLADGSAERPADGRRIPG